MTRSAVEQPELKSLFKWEKPRKGFVLLPIDSPDLPCSLTIEEMNLRYQREPERKVFETKGGTTEVEFTPQGPEYRNNSKIHVYDDTIWIVSVLPTHKDVLESYRPLTERPTLYRKFADLEADTEILDFANAFGLLFKSTHLNGPSDIVKHKCKKNTGTFLAETISLWKKEIVKMREAVRLWDLVKVKDGSSSSAKLKQLIVWKRGDAQDVWYIPEGSTSSFYQQITKNEDALFEELEFSSSSQKRELRESITRLLSTEDHRISAYASPSQMRQWRQNYDVVGPAMLFVLHSVNKALDRQVTVQVRPTSLSGDKAFVIEEVPANLLTAMWFQFSLEILGKRNIKQCPVCEQWFDATRNSKQIYCRSKASGCRKKASRIMAMLRDALPIEEIAQRNRVSKHAVILLSERAGSNKAKSCSRET